MKIVNHRLVGARLTWTPNHSGTIVPRYIVMHYTAGWTSGGAIETLTSRSSKASAHVVVDLDGTITQLVPFDLKAWHAGPSRFDGHTGLNECSIGIEIVNPGYLRKTGSNEYQDAYGVRHRAGRGHMKGCGLMECTHPRVGSGVFHWPLYTPAQLASVQALTVALNAEYDILDVVSHEQIDTRGWKTDPGPAFPLNRFRSLVQDRSQGAVVHTVLPDKLNMRWGPGPSYAVLGQLRAGNRVEEHARQGVWVRVTADGWVHGEYLQRAR